MTSSLRSCTLLTMLTLSEIMNTDELDELIESGYVRKKEHDSFPLYILNYAEKAQFENKWVPETLQSRGLVVRSDTGEVWQRCMPKFFSWDSAQAPRITTGPTLVSRKEDGSMLTLVRDVWTSPGEVKYFCATRGSFQSSQALWSTDFFNKNYQDYGFDPRENKTYVFEVCGAFNRIVLSYGDFEGLILLEVLDNETGLLDIEEFDLCSWPVKVERRLINITDNNYDKVHEELDALDDENEEGLVFYFVRTGHRVKAKLARYVERHRIVTNTNARNLWLHISQGKGLEEYLNDVPDEFAQWVIETAQDLAAKFSAINLAAISEFQDLEPLKEDRAKFAAMAKRSPYADILFLLLDNKKTDWQIWKRIKPDADRPFSYQSVDVA